MSSKLNNGTTLWEEEFLPKYQEIFNNTKDTWIDHEYINIYTDCAKKVEIAKLNYKKQHNKLFYYFFCFLLLPLSIITIIPAYWAIKKYKELKNNKETLLNIINETKNNKLNIHHDIVNNLKIIDIVQSFANIINYQHKGPIPSKLIEEMQNLSLFDLSNYGTNTNSYNTSWGIMNNKIVIHASKQTHKQYQKTYTGSITVPYYTRDSEGNSITASTVVTANYTHPAFDITSSRFTYAFMESCSNLEFKYDGKKSKLFDNYDKKNHFSPLENEAFDKKFKWYRNDDVQFRMIFTPYAQERFLLELNNKKEPPLELEWSKSSSFITNNYQTIQFNYIIYNNINYYINQFLTDADCDLNFLIDNIYLSIISYYQNLYKNMNYMFLTTIMPSENHLSIINAIERSKQKINNYNNYFFAHNILSEFIDKEIIRNDTNCFNTLVSSNVKNIANCDIYFSTMNGLTYSIVKKVIYIPTYSSVAQKTVNVPVYYNDYIPQEANATIAYGFVNCDKYYYDISGLGVKTNINNNDLLSLISQLPDDIKVVLKDRIIAFFFQKEINEEVINDIIVQLLNDKES